MNVFEYGEKEIRHLKERDPALGRVMDEIGLIRRGTTPDLYASLVHQIISQQISGKGAETVRTRLNEAFDGISPEKLGREGAEEIIRKCGTSMRKARYIRELSEKVRDGALDLAALRDMPDGEVCAGLSSLKGIGVWTAEMLMIFSMQRPDIMSWGDTAIHRGLRMLYRHRAITRELFEKYRRRYSPYASVACLYLWAIAGGECRGLADPAPMSDARKKRKARQRRNRARADKTADDSSAPARRKGGKRA